MKAAGTDGRYEHSDANASRLLFAGFLLALLLVGSMAASAWVSQAFTDEFQAEDQASPVSALRRMPDGPVLQTDPAREIERQRAWEERMLTGTEWVDPLNGVVRIPLRSAIDLVLRDGFPVRTEDRK